MFNQQKGNIYRQLRRLIILILIVIIIFLNEFYDLLDKAKLYFGMYRLQLNDLVNPKINRSSN